MADYQPRGTKMDANSLNTLNVNALETKASQYANVMSMPQDWSAIVTFVVYLAIVMLVGLIAYMATRNLSDYVLGGRKLGGAVAALSAGASDMSSWLLMGLPGAIYMSGLKQIWVVIGLVAGAYCSWKFVAKPLRVYSEVAKDSVTVPAYLDNRFRDNTKIIRLIAALATLIFFIFYIASGLLASGVLLSLTFKLNYVTALWLGAGIIMLYTSIGGFLAVSWTDFFQGTLMLFCLLLAPLFAIQNIGGWDVGIQKLLQVKPDYLEWTKDLTALKLISLFSWGLGYLGMPHILVRFMAVKTVKEIPLARMVCMWWMSLSMVGAVLVGMVGAIHFCHCPLDNHETVFMALGEQVFAPWIMGIILAAILSSSMCAVDSQMLAASSAITEDIYRALFRRKASQRELMWVGRGTVAIIALVAIFIASKQSHSIMELVAFAWAGLGATFGASVVFSLFWKRCTRNGVIVGMLLGAVTVIVWRALGLHVWMYELLPGFLMSCLGVVIVSYFDKKPSAEILHEFEKVWGLCKSEAAINPARVQK
jgi:sodium/proline symporter